MKKRHPTLRDENLQQLEKNREEKAMDERRAMPQYRPGGFASS